MRQKKIKPFGTVLYSIVSLLFLSCGEIPTPGTVDEILKFTGDFENGNIEGYYLLVPDTNVNAVVVDSPVRKGNYALRNTLRPDDYIYNGYRSELSIYNCAEYKTEVYYAFSLMIDTAYADEQFNLLSQWQDLPDFANGEAWEPFPVLKASPPPVAFVYVDGNFELKMNDSPNTNSQTFLVGKKFKVTKGEWYDVVFRIYWSDDDSAYIEYWINGEVMTPYNGKDYRFYARNLFNRAGNYFKFGQYRGKEKTEHTNTVYFDEVKIGESFEEVSL